MGTNVGAISRQVAARLAKLRDQMGDAYLLGITRIGFGLLLLNEAWLATKQLQAAGYFGGYFHQPFLPEALVPSEATYQWILCAQWVAAALVLTGRVARPALLVAAFFLVYTMLCDRLWFHHYRHTMAAFSILLAFTPCDRYLVLGRSPQTEPAPLWAQNAMKAQVSVMYIASAGSKLLDPDWRGGLMMRGMVTGFARLLLSRGVPVGIVRALETPLGASLMAKGAIGTELSLAALLWWPKSRRWALWMGLFFHLTISLMTPVQLFTAEMLLVYVLFATPDAGARDLRFAPPRQHLLANAVDALDWLRRFKLEPMKGAPLAIIDRGGEEQRGLNAIATLFGALPALFPLWPLTAAASRLRGSPTHE